MIDRQKIYHLISGKASFTSISIEEIDQLVAEYPFFQTAWMLKGKASFMGNSQNFKNELPKIALHVNDRAKLYQYIHATSDVFQENEASKNKLPNAVGKEAIVPKSELERSVKSSMDSQIINKADSITQSEPKTEKSIQDLINEKRAKLSTSNKEDKKQQPIEVETKQVSEVIENKNIPPIKLSSKRVYKEIYDEDKEMQENISDVLKWQLEQTEGQTNLKILPDDLFLISAPVTNKSISSKRETKLIEEDGFQFDFEEEELLELDAKFEDIVPENSQIKNDEQEEEIELMDDDEVNQLISQNTSAYKLDSLPDEQDYFDRSNQELIEQFLESEPRIVPKADFSEEDLEDISASSIEENEGYITDTLAKIYAQQGKLKKALATYEKLILKYPEKKAYFTAQIGKIKAKK